MPYPNEHSCRLRDPGDFQEDSFRRIERGEGQDKLSIIIGRLKGETSTTSQAYRYPVGTWDADRAKAHCGEAGGSFEAARREEELDESKIVFQVQTKTVRGVEIFASGEHNGDTYTDDNLDAIVEAFYALKGALDPPLKLGHTSDEFNLTLARKMGVEPDVVTGEQGKGAIALGWVEHLRRKGGKLVADFLNVPVPVAELIESGLYSKVSAELYIDYKDQGNNYPFALCGVALLGAELPAVSEIKGLEGVAIYKAMREADKVAELEKDMDSAEGIFEQIMGLFGVLRKRLTKKAEELPEDEKPEEEPENKPDKCQEDLEMKEINVALGLPEEAKLEEAVAKVKELQTPAEPKEFTDLKAEFASLQTKLTQAQDELKSERRKAKVAHYTEMARGWTNISGKPEDMAEQIVKVEEVDEAAGKILVEHFQHANEAAKVVTQPIGTPAEGDKPALTTFEKLVEDNLKDYNGALARERCFADTVRKYPDEYKEFRKQHPAK